MCGYKVTRDTNIFYKHHNIHIAVYKPTKIIERDEKMNDDCNNNEGDNKIAGGRPPFCRIPQSANSGPSGK